MTWIPKLAIDAELLDKWRQKDWVVWKYYVTSGRNIKVNLSEPYSFTGPRVRFLPVDSDIDIDTE